MKKKMSDDLHDNIDVSVLEEDAVYRLGYDDGAERHTPVHPQDGLYMAGWFDGESDTERDEQLDWF